LPVSALTLLSGHGLEHSSVTSASNNQLMPYQAKFFSMT